MANDLNKIYNSWMESKGDLMAYDYDYFHDNHSVVPVYQRVSVSAIKEASHTNIHINFFEDIINRKVGYMASNITTKVEDKKLKELIEEFNEQTKQKTMNIESISNASISGLSHRLLYTDNGIIKIKNILGWQVVYNYKDDIYNPDEAYYYYTTTDMLGKPTYHCDIYNRNTVIYTEKTKVGDKESYIQIDEQLHNFNEVPIFPFQNNNYQTSDCSDALNIMDTYDEIISDTSGELKAARLAYLKIWGDLNTGEYDDGTEIPVPTYLKEFGTMLFGTDELGNQLGNAEFLEKKLDDTSITNMLNRLRGHIYEVSGSVDLKELTDSTDARIFTIQASLSRLENNSSVTEQFTKMALKKQYSLFLYWLNEFNAIKYDISEIEFQFDRVFIKDKAALADMLMKLMTVMSTIDAFTISELFDNP
ncbi:MAG: hypothetical protein B6229_00390, partial [Spirochaetaceae bacterium 4572_7]